jgi:hypothetical protein
VLPGDDLIQEPIGTLSHAITIRQPARDVWPWLAQMGAGSRAGWYSWQYNGTTEPTRLFYLTGSMFRIPLQGYHRYVGPSATMRVKAAARAWQSSTCRATR